MDNSPVPPLWQPVIAEAHRAALTLEQFRDMAAKLFIEHSLSVNKGNQCHTANLLGVHRNTLSRAIKELQIQVVNPKVKRRERRFRMKLSQFAPKEVQLAGD